MSRSSRTETPEEGKAEDALLLNPFDVVDPLAHLDFDDEGVVTGLTERGDVTVEVCGLSRPSLVEARNEALQRVGDLVQDLTRPGLDHRQIAEKRRDLIRAGEWDKPFAAAVRSVARKCGLEWSTLVEDDEGTLAAEKELEGAE